MDQYEITSRKRVGLALGGGVVRGLAHIGVLEVLLAAGVPIDMVAGTSAGSIVALGFCAGHPAEKVNAFARSLSWMRLARPVLPLRGLISFNGLSKLLVAEFGDRRLEDLPLPCVIATTDIQRGEPVYLQSGRAAPAVQASCSVPGFVTPVKIDGRLLCEGGLADMLPVAPLRHLGAEYIIGVDIFAFKLRKFLGPLGYGLGGLEIALENAGGGVAGADCIIAPALGGNTYLRFSRRDALIERGRQAARRVLPVLCRDLGLDPARIAALPPPVAGALPIEPVSGVTVP